MPTALWRSISVAALGIAIFQNLVVADRVKHATTICWKMGVEGSLISASIHMLIVFGMATAVLAAVGLLTTDRLAQRQSRFRFCSLLAVQMLLSGALVWFGLVASPVVALWP